MNTKTDIWIDPRTTIKLFSTHVIPNAKDNEELLSLVKLRKYRITAEAWVAAMYLMALREKHKDINYYLQQNPLDPPDFFGLGLYMENGIAKGYIKNIEVFRYVNESQLSLAEEIKKKIDKSYGSDTVLVCHITRSGFKESIGEIGDSLKEFDSKYEIWIVGGSSSDGNGDQLVAQVFPKIGQLFTFNIPDILKEKVEYPFVKRFPMTSLVKSDSLVIEKLGKEVLLTESFELIE